MATWQPPIPAGAFWTEDALKIGPALSLLGYCYDKVGRDGHVQLNIRVAADDMGVPYPTVKRWWDALKQTGYIETYQDHRRGGMNVQMSNEWLDWRHRFVSEMILKTEESSGNGIISDTKEDSLAQKSNKQSIRSDTKPAMYKVLISTDQAESIGGSEDQDRTARTHPPAVAILFDIFPGAAISVEQTDDLCSISNLAVWREVLMTWRTNGYRPRIGNLLDRYEKELARATTAKGHSNGRPIRPNPGQNHERAQWTTADLDTEL